MKLHEAIRLGANGVWLDAQVRRNPGNRAQWFVMLRDKQSKPFMLVGDDDRPITAESLDKVAEYIQSIGLKEFSVYL